MRHAILGWWILSIAAWAPGAAPIAQAGEAEAGVPLRQHLLLLIVKDGDSFRIQSTVVVPSGLPKQRDPGRCFPWQLRLIGAGGKLLHEAGLEDPTVLRGEFRDPRDPSRIEAHFVRRVGPVSFAVRIPVAQAERIEFLALRPGQTRAATLAPDAYVLLGSARLDGKE